MSTLVSGIPERVNADADLKVFVVVLVTTAATSVAVFFIRGDLT
jgi:hypothetical protein